MPVTIINAQRKISFDVKRLRVASNLALDYLGLTSFDCGIKCSGDTTLRKLNRLYRSVDAPTDVLSFPQIKFRKPGTPPRRLSSLDDNYLGDIVLGLPYIQRQCVQANINLDDRLLIVMTHGICHLIGYTHGRSTSEAKNVGKTICADAKEGAGNFVAPAGIIRP